MRRRAWLVVAVGVACACGDALAPHNRVSLAIIPSFSENVYELLSGDLDALHVKITRLPDTTMVVYDSTIAVDTSGNVDLPLTLALLSNPESFFVRLEGLRSSDGTKLYSGADTITISSGTSATPVDTVRVSYVGPCGVSSGCTVTVAPQDSTLSQGDSVALRLSVDSAGTPVAGVPIALTNLSAGLVTVSSTRHVRALTGSPGGLARVVAMIRSSTDTLRVTIASPGSPAIGLNPTSATFTTTAGGSDPAPQTVTVTNAGVGTLSGLSAAVTYVTGTPGWLAAGVSPTTAPATLTLTPTLGTLPAGTYTATVTVSSSLSGVAPQPVSVTLQVNPGPAIGLATKSTTFSGTAGGADPTPQTVNITNTGGGTLSGLAPSITYTSGSGWLGVNLSTTTAPSVLTLTPTLGSLTPGSYHARVTVSSSLSGVASDTVGVTFTVSAGPPALVVVTPGYATLRIAASGNTAQLADTVKDGVGNLLSPSLATWTSRSPSVASVSASGLVTASGRGIATIVASAGTGADSILVAVGDTTNHGDALVLAITNSRAFGQRKVGQTVQVDVLVDLKAVAADSLGSYTARYTWVQSVVRFDSSTAGTFSAPPTVNTDSTAGGILRFAAASANDGLRAPTLIHMFFTALTASSDNHQLQLTELSGSAPNYINFYLLGHYFVASGNAAIAP
ncbi:MAG TPA: Ig-like domain-containing protein [Gemmatimonadales bacterium]|nr:Ig-like domain-containing protein [Gemmatimonadales bacterium]